MNEYELMENP